MRLERSKIVPMNKIEEMRNLAEEVRKFYLQKAKDEEDFDDMPDDFRGKFYFSVFRFGSRGLATI
jgi:hypothetical protein